MSWWQNYAKNFEQLKKILDFLLRFIKIMSAIIVKNRDNPRNRLDIPAPLDAKHGKP
jgi:hypothetical protein